MKEEEQQSMTQEPVVEKKDHQPASTTVAPKRVEKGVRINLAAG